MKLGDRVEMTDEAKEHWPRLAANSCTGTVVGFGRKHHPHKAIHLGGEIRVKRDGVKEVYTWGEHWWRKIG